MELPYIAGLFDGEGTVVITKPSPAQPRKHQLRVAVCMTHERTVRTLHAAVGRGHVKVVRAQKYNPNASTRYDWVLVGTDSVVQFLTSIRPWLVTKLASVDAALQFAELNGVRGRPVTDALLDAREAARLTLLEANRGSL